ncbi:MAG: class I SAM-dependent methyltransferase [Candidatus Izemoplasmatales bacterium]
MKKHLSKLFIPFLIMATSFYFLINSNISAAIFVGSFLPFSIVLMFGSFRKRLLNILPIIAMYSFLYIGITSGAWGEAWYLFSVYPVIGLVIQPVRKPIKYVTLFISLLFFILNYFDVLTLSVFLKTAVILFIYIVYIPPYLETKLKKYQNYPLLFQLIAPIYGLFYRHQIKNYQKSLQKAEHLLMFSKGESVLDVGSGTGALARVLYDDYKLVVTGVEPTGNMIKVSKKKNRGLPMRFIQGNVLEKLPFENQEFDYAVASYVAHGLRKEERQKMYDEMKRVSLKKVILFEYNQNRTVLSDIVEWAEGGDYFRFINQVMDELTTNFNSVQKYDLHKTGSVYICTKN